ncbi:IS3 family transposase [Rhodococcus erythropolis]
MLTAQRMQVAPLTYRNWKTAPPSARVVADAHYCAPTTLQKAVDSAEGLYGRRKMTAHLRRSGHQVAACTVDRLMRDEGLAGIVRGPPAPHHRPGWKERTPGPGPARSRLHRRGAEP